MIHILLCFIFSLNISAYFEHSLIQNKNAEMNGIKFQNFKNFPQQWKLISVRYRQDSNEMRFTYANDLAVSAMKSLKPNYPDGAAFGKIGFIVENDPSFPSSLAPTGTRRFQIMLKNKKQYKNSDGWGYALFDSNGQLYNEDLKAKTNACIACHRLVPERDYVFSRPIQTDFKINPESLKEKNQKNKIYNFKNITWNNLKITTKLSSKPSSNFIDSLEGEIQKNAFSGTLDEIIPLLIENSKTKSISSILFINQNNFSLVIPTINSKRCNNKDRAFKIIIIFNGKAVRDSEFCQQ